VLLVCNKQHLLSTIMPPKVAEFYERRLAARNVTFARNFTFEGKHTCAGHLSLLPLL
jgi:hypothetical protein